MIVTVTLNAALDVAYEAEGLSWHATRDVSRVRHRAGGRGVAVARVLHTFGHEVLAAGLTGGAAGELIREDLGRSGIPVAFTEIGRESRRVLEVTDPVQQRTMRLREPGPYVTTEELGRFAGDYRRLLADATAVVLCGTLPAGLPPEIYGSLATWAAEAGVPVILNAGGSPLRHAAARRPDLVVPDADDDAAARPPVPQPARRVATGEASARRSRGPAKPPRRMRLTMTPARAVMRCCGWARRPWPPRPAAGSRSSPRPGAGMPRWIARGRTRRAARRPDRWVRSSRAWCPVSCSAGHGRTCCGTRSPWPPRPTRPVTSTWPSTNASSTP